jgi:hypothetical protein
VFVEKDERSDKAEDYFIRQGITIPEVSSLKHKGIRAIVSITDPLLSSFLGDAENPAHTEWERNSRKFKAKYIRGPRTLDFVKTSPREIVKILTQPRKSRDEDLLRHLFGLPDETHPKPDEDKRQAKGDGQAQQSDGMFSGVEGARYLQLSPVKGGFRLRRNPRATQFPRFITVWMAYEVRNGNPFKKYTPLDFDVSRSPIQIKLDGGRILRRQANILQIEVLNGAFQLAVAGFDPHRDLRVKTNP